MDKDIENLINEASNDIETNSNPIYNELMKDSLSESHEIANELLSEELMTAENVDSEVVESTVQSNKESKKNNKKLMMIIGIIVGILLIVGGATFAIISNNNKQKEIEAAETAKKEKEEKDSVEIAAIKEQNEEAFIALTDAIEYGTTWTYEELISYLVNTDKLVKDTSIVISVDGKELSEGDKLEFDMVGTYKIVITLTIEYTSDDKSETVTVDNKLTIVVEDTIVPVIKGFKNQTITEGDKIDLLAGITATDEVEGDIEVKLVENVDLSKAGTYTIRVYAEDSHNNRAEAEFTITVKEKPKNTNTGSGNSGNNNGNTNNNNNNNTGGNNNTGSGGSNSTSCTFTNTLKKRGYKSDDKDACEKDKEATAIVNKYASQLKATGKTGWDLVQAAAEVVAENYSRAGHTESGYNYRTPYGLFVTHEASCAGCTRALIQLLEALGFTNLTHANENGWTHQWVILTVNGEKGYADGQVGWSGPGCHMLDDNCTQ